MNDQITKGAAESNREIEGRAGSDEPKRGFAALSPERRREIASKGGKASHAAGTGHRFASGEEAAAMGRKGGKARRRATSAE